jgi:hypothetical protein
MRPTRQTARTLGKGPGGSALGPVNGGGDADQGVVGGVMGAAVPLKYVLALS